MAIQTKGELFSKTIFTEGFKNDETTLDEDTLNLLVDGIKLNDQDISSIVDEMNKMKNSINNLDTTYATDTDIASINEALNTLEDKDLIATNPSATIRWENTGSFEVGSIITPKYVINFKDGKYKYPLPNGTAIESSISGYSVNLNGEKRNTAFAEFGEIEVIEDTNLTGTATVSFGASDVTPVSNLGREKPDSKYSGKENSSLSKTTITGYREGCFYGTRPTKIDIESLNSAKIRDNWSNKLGTNYISGKQLSLDIPIGTQTILIACPANCNGPSNVINTTVNAPMTDLFGIDKMRKEVQISGANEYTPIGYNIWVYQPAEPYSSPATLEITLG